MACDRFIKFEKAVPEDQLRMILEDYAAGTVTKNGDRFFLTLVGKPSFPFKRIFPGQDRINQTERWIEIWFDPDDNKTIDVLTRMADEYTNNVAEGIARMLAGFFEGELD